MGLLSRGWKPKRLRDQVMVITGASSGIGLATARMAAAQGACVVLTSRNERDLRVAVQEIDARGGRATHVVADVAVPDDMDRVADIAIREFGGFDTWVNNAGVSIYGKLIDVPMEDKKRLSIPTSGASSTVAVRRSDTSRGGAVPSSTSAASCPIGPFLCRACTRHRNMRCLATPMRCGWSSSTTSFRSPITLVKPASINTPFVEHARTYMPGAPALPPPVYAPEVVAKAILRCAERRVREITVGGGGRMITAIGRLAPKTTDTLMEHTMFTGQQGQEASGSIRRQPVSSHARRRGKRAVRKVRQALEPVHEGQVVERHPGAAVHCRGRGAGRYADATQSLSRPFPVSLAECVDASGLMRVARRGGDRVERQRGATLHAVLYQSVCGMAAAPRARRWCPGTLRPNERPGAAIVGNQVARI